jgi:hypothetical protein
MLLWIALKPAAADLRSWPIVGLFGRLQTTVDSIGEHSSTRLRVLRSPVESTGEHRRRFVERLNGMVAWKDTVQPKPINEPGIEHDVRRRVSS